MRRTAAIAGPQWSALFGAEVRHKRVRLGLVSQQALAERLGWKDHASIGQIEMGNVKANLDVAIELARYLQIDLNAIMGITQVPGPDVPTADWMHEMFMVRLPSRVYEIWPPVAQQEILVRMVEEMGRAMRDTMQGPVAPGAAASPAPPDVRVEAEPVRLSELRPGR